MGEKDPVLKAAKPIQTPKKIPPLKKSFVASTPTESRKARGATGDPRFAVQDVRKEYRDPIEPPTPEDQAAAGPSSAAPASNRSESPAPRSRMSLDESEERGEKEKHPKKP